MNRPVTDLYSHIVINQFLLIYLYCLFNAGKLKPATSVNALKQTRLNITAVR